MYRNEGYRPKKFVKKPFNPYNKERSVMKRTQFLNNTNEDGGFHFHEIVARRPNLIENDGVIGLIKRVLKQINSSICHTIGPYGSNSIIQNFNQSKSMYVTRDGYTIMKQLIYFDSLPITIKALIDGVSEYMQNRIGDSTSSGIPIISKFYNQLVDEYRPKIGESWKLSPVGVSYILNEISKNIVENIYPGEGKKNSPYIRKFDTMTEDQVIDELANVAGISLNNDYELGRKFAELYRGQVKDGIIRLEEGKGVDDEFVTDSGFILNSISVTDFNKMAGTSTFGNACVLEKPVVLVIDGVVTEADTISLRKLIKVIAFDMKRDILMTANSYSPHFNKLVYDCIDGKVFSEGGDLLDELPIEKQKPVAVKIATIPLGNSSEFQRDMFRDFLVMLNVKGIFSTTMTGDIDLDTVNGVENIIEFVKNHSGECDLFIGGYSNCVFKGCKPEPDKYENHVKELNDQLRKLELFNNESNDLLANKLRNRIWNLTSKQSIIRIGAPNDSTRESKRLIYDDAVRSMDSAIKEGGVALGGNIPICHYIHHNFDKIVETVSDNLSKSKVNIASGSDLETIKSNVKKILSIFKDAFGEAYRTALFNMFQDNDKAREVWENVLDFKNPTIYNMIDDENQSFEETSLIVPITTDLCLLEIIVSVTKDLIVVNKMLPSYPPNFKIEQINNLISSSRR